MLVPFYATKAEVPEALAEHYTERDGKFILDVTPTDGYALENIAGLIKTRDDWKTKAERDRGALEKFGDLDPVAALEALNKVKDYDPTKLDPRIAELTTRLEGAATAESALKTLLATAQKGAAKTELLARYASKLRDEAGPFVGQMLDNYMDIDANGQLYVVNDDRSGPRMTAKPGDFTSNMQPDELMNLLFESGTAKAAKANFIKPSDVSGISMFMRAAGAPGPNLSTDTPNNVSVSKSDFLKLPVDDQAAKIRENPSYNQYFD